MSQFVADRLAAQGFPKSKLITHYIGIDLAQMTPPRQRAMGGCCSVAALSTKRVWIFCWQQCGGCAMTQRVGKCPASTLLVQGPLERCIAGAGEDRSATRQVFRMANAATAGHQLCERRKRLLCRAGRRQMAISRRFCQRLF